jgi:hypothetical protein
MPFLSVGDAVRDTPGVSPIAAGPPTRAQGSLGEWGKPTEHMGREGGLWKDGRNPQPEPLEDNGEGESMGAEGGAWEGGIPQTVP